MWFTITILLNPTKKKGTKAAYTELKKNLIKELQSEVFMRITNNRKGAVEDRKRGRRRSYGKPVFLGCGD